MDDIEKSELDTLKQKLARSKKDLALTTTAFTLGCFASGFLLRLYLRDQQSVTVSMLPIVGCAAFLLGSFLAALYVAVSRLGDFLRTRNENSARTQSYFYQSLQHIRKK